MPCDDMSVGFLYSGELLELLTVVFLRANYGDYIILILLLLLVILMLTELSLGVLAFDNRFLGGLRRLDFLLEIRLERRLDLLLDLLRLDSEAIELTPSTIF